MLVLIAVMGTLSLIAAWNYDPSALQNQRYNSIATSARIEYAGMYLVLAVALAIMTYNMHERLRG